MLKISFSICYRSKSKKIKSLLCAAGAERTSIQICVYFRIYCGFNPLCRISALPGQLKISVSAKHSKYLFELFYEYLYRLMNLCGVRGGYGKCRVGVLSTNR